MQAGGYVGIYSKYVTCSDKNFTKLIFGDNTNATMNISDKKAVQKTEKFASPLTSLQFPIQSRIVQKRV